MSTFLTGQIRLRKRLKTLIRSYIENRAVMSSRNLVKRESNKIIDEMAVKKMLMRTYSYL